jgi:hypothetical protein
VSERLRNPVTKASQSVPKALIEIGMSHCDVTKLQTELLQGDGNRRTSKFSSSSGSCPTRANDGKCRPGSASRIPTSGTATIKSVCSGGVAHHHFQGGARLTWFGIFRCPELEIRWAFWASSSTNLSRASPNIVLSHGEICTLVPSSNYFSDSFLIQRIEYEINMEHDNAHFCRCLDISCRPAIFCTPVERSRPSIQHRRKTGRDNVFDQRPIAFSTCDLLVISDRFTLNL